MAANRRGSRARPHARGTRRAPHADRGPLRARGGRVWRAPPSRQRLRPRRAHTRVPGQVNPRLLQLASPSLPVGAYSYSQGLEAAVEARVVHDAPSAQRWIGDVLELSMAGLEAPILARTIDAW